MIGGKANSLTGFSGFSSLIVVAGYEMVLPPDPQMNISCSSCGFSAIVFHSKSALRKEEEVSAQIVEAVDVATW